MLFDGSMPQAMKAAAIREDAALDRLGDGMQIDNAEQAIMRRLQIDEFLQRAEIVAEMQASGRLDAGEDALRAGIGDGGFGHGPGHLACLISAAKPAGGR
jgi:hypothetical protein